MKLNNKAIILSLVLLLVLVALIIVIRRRDRKVYLSGEFRLNPDEYVYLYDQSLSGSSRIFYKGTLDYVVLPFDFKKKSITDTDAYGSVVAVYYPVKAVGFKQPNGQIQKLKLKEYAYINSAYLDI